MEEIEIITAYIRSRYTDELKAYLKGTGIKFPENEDTEEVDKYEE